MSLNRSVASEQTLTNSFVLTVHVPVVGAHSDHVTSFRVEQSIGAELVRQGAVGALEVFVARFGMRVTEHTFLGTGQGNGGQWTCLYNYSLDEHIEVHGWVKFYLDCHGPANCPPTQSGQQPTECGRIGRIAFSFIVHLHRNKR